MELLELIHRRRSIRKYTAEQITHEEMEKILEAGAAAPNAGGAQRSMIVGVRDAKLTRLIGKLNFLPFDRSRLIGGHVSDEQPSVIDNPNIKDGFYGAPAVVALFGQQDFLFSVADAFCSAENIVLMATELGLASCIVSRAEETFVTEEGQKLLKAWGVPENYICRAFVTLGHIDGDYPHAKRVKTGRVKIIEEEMK